MAKYSSQGMLLKEGANSLDFSALATVAQLDDINPSIGDDLTEIDVTDYSSSVREFVMGLSDGGTMDIGGFFDASDAQHADMIAANKDKALRKFRVVFPDGTNNTADSAASTLDFAAYVSGFSAQSPIDDAIKFTASLRVSGTKVFTPRTAS